MHYKPCTDTDTHYKTASTQSGQFLVTEKSARHSTIGPITFIAPLSISPVDVQTEEPTLGDTSIVSQSVTNNRCTPSCGGAQEKSGGAQHCAPHLQIASDATESGTLKNTGIPVGISLLAHSYSEMNVLPVWRPPSWICREFKHHLQHKNFNNYFLLQIASKV